MPYLHTWLKAQFLAMRSILLEVSCMVSKTTELSTLVSSGLHRHDCLWLVSSEAGNPRVAHSSDCSRTVESIGSSLSVLFF